jgi:hypothetical protein
MSSPRPFMAEHDVVRAACSRSEHPVPDSVFSKRVGILLRIGSAVRAGAAAELGYTAWVVNRAPPPDLLQAVVVSPIAAIVHDTSGQQSRESV